MTTSKTDKKYNWFLAILLFIIVLIGLLCYYFITRSDSENNNQVAILKEEIVVLHSTLENSIKLGFLIETSLKDSILNVTNNKDKIINLTERQREQLRYHIDSLSKALNKALAKAPQLPIPNSTYIADSLQIVFDDLKTKYDKLYADYNVLRNSMNIDSKKCLDTIIFYQAETKRLKRKLIVKDFKIIYSALLAKTNPIRKWKNMLLDRENLTINTKKLRNIVIDFSVAHGEVNDYQNKPISIKIKFEKIKPNYNGSVDEPSSIKEPSFTKTYIAGKTKVSYSFLELIGDKKPNDDQIKDLNSLKKITIFIEGSEVYQYSLPPHDAVDEKD